jgi:HJR/Mrr/RecB family endonuclease
MTIVFKMVQQLLQADMHMHAEKVITITNQLFTATATTAATIPTHCWWCKNKTPQEALCMGDILVA